MEQGNHPGSSYHLLLDVCEKLPGAAVVIGELHKHYVEIDPNSKIGFSGFVYWLYDWGIKGSLIWQYYKDYCDEDIVKFVMVKKALQLEIFPAWEIKELLRSTIPKLHPFNFKRMLVLIREKDPDFAKNYQFP